MPGVKFSLWRDRITGSLGYYDTRETNNRVAVRGPRGAGFKFFSELLDSGGRPDGVSP
jgi:hypothetical protein